MIYDCIFNTFPEIVCCKSRVCEIYFRTQKQCMRKKLHANLFFNCFKLFRSIMYAHALFRVV